MAPLVPRFHLFELDDQPWFPSFLRARVQAALTLFWNIYVPVLQPSSTSSLVSSLLRQLLGPDIAQYTYVDFCAGAGGPTPAIEESLNAQLVKTTPAVGTEFADTEPFASGVYTTRQNSPSSPTNGEILGQSGVDFVLTDIAPHPTAWSRASAASPHLHYIPSSIDASSAPSNLLTELTKLSPLANDQTRARLATRPPFRLFFLAFHHFPDSLAKAILKDTLENSSGFGIFELQDRSIGGLFTVLALGPFLWLTTWYYFWNDPIMLIWTYVFPVVPFVIVFDGIVSCLRTRTGHEITAILSQLQVNKEGWRFRNDVEVHTWPGGNLTWFVGTKE